MKPSIAPRLTRRSLGRIAAAATVAVPAAGTLVACSGESDPNAITFLSWDNAEVMGPVIEQFEKENPDCHDGGFVQDSPASPGPSASSPPTGPRS